MGGGGECALAETKRGAYDSVGRNGKEMEDQGPRRALPGYDQRQRRFERLVPFATNNSYNCELSNLEEVFQQPQRWHVRRKKKTVEEEYAPFTFLSRKRVHKLSRENVTERLQVSGHNIISAPVRTAEQVVPQQQPRRRLS